MQRVVAAELSGSVALYSTTDILAVCEVSVTTENMCCMMSRK